MIYAQVNINNITNEEYEKWYSLMSDEKKLRIDKFRFDDDKKRSIAGEMLAKKSIAEYLTIPAEDIVFANGENHKPYAVNCDIEFNISHCEDMVVCAVCDSPIGIDTERIRPISAKLLKKFFSQAEQTYVLGSPPRSMDYDTELNSKQQKRFFEIWTGKEAYLKYTGEGLVEDLANLQHDKSRITTILKDDYVISIYY